jgi:predicted DNA-binding transcriptional regulator AlpA
MRTRLRDEFGSAGDLFADFLGSTSPNTSVPQNWDMSVQAIRKFVRGDYDKEIEAFRDHLDAGGTVDAYDGPLVKKENAKLFGMNSKRLMTSMVDLWRKVEKGTAPKARNFSGNLIGFSNRATIDVWAARTLRRLAGLKRIPPRAEQGVSGEHLTDPSKIGGGFGFGQDVFAEAARQLNETLPKADRLGDDDLQAIIWFKEKEHWAKNNWSPAEGGSFEEQADKAQFSRYQGGATIDRGQGPSDEEMASAASEVVRVLKDDPKVVSYNTSPTIGQYVGDTERAFDIEMTVQKDFEPIGLARELATLAKKSNQDDIFISKVVKDGEDNPNARPGIEIYFQSKKTYDEILPIIEQMNARKVDGFTFGVDMRETEVWDGYQLKKSEDKYRSLRVQYVPEFSMRYDKEFFNKIKENPDIIDEIVQEKRRELIDLAEEIGKIDGVSLSKTYSYDTVVIGRENYDVYTKGTRERSNLGNPEVWFGQSRRENVARAVARLEGGTK